MREIKFRLVKDNKIVGYEKHTQNKGNFKSSIFHSSIDDNCVGYEWSNIAHFPNKFIDCDFKEQFIGLKEIYEGDKIRITHEAVSMQDKSFVESGIIIYQDSCCRFIIKTKSRLLRIEGYLEDITIIGNNHQ